MGTARKDKAETATARSNVYGLLANLFRAEPTVALVRELQSHSFVAAFSELGLCLGDAFHETSPEQLAEDLALEYTRLFIGPGPRISPHESLHIELGNVSENAMWGPQTVEVKRFIEAMGLSYHSDFTGLPDHISAEFELMQKLAEREARSWSEGDEEDARWCRGAQRQFFEDHILAWVPRFCDRVIDGAEQPFYREVAKVTKSFLEFETEGARNSESAEPLKASA